MDRSFMAQNWLARTLIETILPMATKHILLSLLCLSLLYCVWMCSWGAIDNAIAGIEKNLTPWGFSDKVPHVSMMIFSERVILLNLTANRSFIGPQGSARVALPSWIVKSENAEQKKVPADCLEII